MIEIKYTGDELWARIERAAEIVKQRLRRVTESLNAADIPYAVVGGNADQHWVAQVDESVVRNTRDVSRKIRLDGKRKNVTVGRIGPHETDLGSSSHSRQDFDPLD